MLPSMGVTENKEEQTQKGRKYDLLTGGSSGSASAAMTVRQQTG